MSFFILHYAPRLFYILKEHKEIVMHKKIFFFVVVFCLLAGVIGGISMKSKKSSLKTYEKKRNFGATPEPRARVKKT